MHKNEVNQSSAAKNAVSELARNKFFYGWVVAIAACIVIMAASNIQYTFGVFMKPLIKEFGWSRAAISGANSIRLIVYAIFCPIAGMLSDRFGARKLILTGVILAAAGYILLAQLGNLWQLYTIMSLVMGIGSALVFIPAVSTVTKWFGEKAALPNGIVVSGHSLAQIIIPPVLTYMLFAYGWVTSFVVLGPVMLVIGVAAWVFVKPAEAGQARTASRAHSESIGGHATFAVSQALRTRTFWLILLVNFVAAGCYQLMIVHIVPAATDAGITPTAAAIIVTLSGVGSTIGRLLMGAVARKMGNRPTLVLCLGVQSLLLFALLAARGLVVYYSVILIYGIAYGGISPLIPTLARSYYGSKSLGSIYGTFQGGYGFGGAVGPFLAGYIFDVTGSYFIAFLSAAVFTLVAMLACLSLKRPEQKPVPAPARG